MKAITQYRKVDGDGNYYYSKSPMETIARQGVSFWIFNSRMEVVETLRPDVEETFLSAFWDNLDSTLD